MGKRLLQKEVAEFIGVSEDSVTHWENEKASPQIHSYPSVIQFLGYYPFTHETESLAGKLQQLRYCKGYSYKQMGALFEVDGSTVRCWELKKAVHNSFNQSLIIQLWTQLPEFIKNNSQTNTDNNEKESATIGYGFV
jgi:transcriptional regulator with XRE-family HTH domain